MEVPTKFVVDFLQKTVRFFLEKKVIFKKTDRVGELDKFTELK